jgi:hypothetical protein
MKAVDLAAFLSNNGGYAEFLGSHIERKMEHAVNSPS